MKKIRKAIANKLFVKLMLISSFFVKSTGVKTFVSLQDLVQVKTRLGKYSLGITLADIRSICLFKFRDCIGVKQGYFRRDGKSMAVITGVELVDTLINKDLSEQDFKSFLESSIGGNFEAKAWVVDTPIINQNVKEHGTDQIIIDLNVVSDTAMINDLGHAIKKEAISIEDSAVIDTNTRINGFDETIKDSKN
jgi:hypothetical protein